MNKKLLQYQDLKYREFTSKLTVKDINIIGIRVPVLRKIADKFTLEELSDDTLEELLLQAFIITKEKDINKILENIDMYVPKINCWNTCDNFCQNLKITKKYPSIIFDHIIKYKTGSLYERRFLLVMLLCYYVNDSYIEKIKEIIFSINYDEYYVMMALSWLISYIAIYSREEAIAIISKIDDKTLRNKSISKIVDSFRISEEDKKIYKEMRK